jgi:hypothetical protein
MTKLLDKAIARVRELPEAEQEQAAEMIIVWADLARQQSCGLSPDERSAVRIGLEQAKRGAFVSDEDMERFWKRHRT